MCGIKINQEEGAAGGEDNVGRLDIAVNDAHFVDRDQDPAQHCQNAARLGVGEKAVNPHIFLQRFPVEELFNNLSFAVSGLHMVNPGDARYFAVPEHGIGRDLPVDRLPNI